MLLLYLCYFSEFQQTACVLGQESLFEWFRDKIVFKLYFLINSDKSFLSG